MIVTVEAQDKRPLFRTRPGCRLRDLVGGNAGWCAGENSGEILRKDGSGFFTKRDLYIK